MDTPSNEAAPEIGASSALIFIPDISGFTKFVHEVEIEHSRLIIAKLLEVILESNQIGLSVSEIEGDAVLFYKLGDAPVVSDIANQSKAMFLKFHQSLIELYKNRKCDCAACGSAKSLSLKIIVHFGKISTIQVKNYFKLLGVDVIMAHRLLKNPVTEREYVLLSEKYLENQLQEDLGVIDWTKLQDGSMEYEHLGLVSYKYASLTPLHKLLDPHG